MCVNLRTPYQCKMPSFARNDLRTLIARLIKTRKSLSKSRHADFLHLKITGTCQKRLETVLELEIMKEIRTWNLGPT